jgi:hypothetical protein
MSAKKAQPQHANAQLTPSQPENPVPIAAPTSELSSNDTTTQVPISIGHPLADIFPMLTGDRLHDLAQDIKDHGLLDAIVMHEDNILDGRGRYLACEMAGVEPKFENYIGDDPVSYVVSHNLHRRHLTESQRAMVAARLADLQRGANQHSKGLPIGSAAKLMNVSDRSVARAKEVAHHGVPELVKAVEGGKLAVSAAAEVSRLPAAAQHAVVTGIADGTATGRTDPARRTRAPRRNQASAHAVAGGGKEVIAADVKTLRTELAAATAEIVSLKAELADKSERLKKAETELAARRLTVTHTEGVTSASTVSTHELEDLDIPPFLDRRHPAKVRAENAAAFHSLQAAWEKATELQGALTSAPAIVRDHFVAVVLRRFGNLNGKSEPRLH